MTEQQHLEQLTATILAGLLADRAYTCYRAETIAHAMELAKDVIEACRK